MGRLPEPGSVIYIAGPMTGRHDLNYPRFNEIERRLTSLGYRVLNPARAFGGATNRERKEYMRSGFEMLMQADAVALMYGWMDSKGAKIEFHMATELGLYTFHELDIPVPDAVH